MRRLAVFAMLAVGCSAELHHGLDERQANELIAELDRVGIPADKAADDRPGTYKVTVPRGEQARAVRALQSRDLPRPGAKGVAEAFAEPGLLPSPAAEHARLQAATAIDLERTLQALPGVSLARVHLVLPDQDPLRPESERSRGSASVLLRTRAAVGIPSDEIRRLVANAAPGLDPGDVQLSYASDEGAVSSRPMYAQLGPLALAPSSRGRAVLLLGTLLVALFALGAAVVVLGLRLRAAQVGEPDR